MKSEIVFYSFFAVLPTKQHIQEGAEITKYLLLR